MDLAFIKSGYRVIHSFPTSTLTEMQLGLETKDNLEEVEPS